MIILDKNNGGIDLYTITAKKEELKRYREEILNLKKRNYFYYLISKKEKVLKQFANSSEIDYANIGNNKNLVALLTKLFNYNGKYDETIQQYINENDLIDRYLQGFKDRRPVVKITNTPNGKNFYYLTNDVSQIDYNAWILREVMELPKELYLLHLLLLGKFDKLQDEPISEQLDLFDINHYKTFTENDLKDLIDAGLMQNTYEDIMKKAALDAHILQKRRK